jgi:hypothetical protein
MAKDDGNKIKYFFFYSFFCLLLPQIEKWANIEHKGVDK